MRRFNPFILSTVSLAAIAATPAYAQEVKADQAPPQTMTSEQETESGTDAQATAAPAAAPAGDAITVTGSRIRRPNLESPLPVTSVGGQEFFQTGNVSVGDTLAELPSIRGTFTQANSTRFLGTAGLNLLDLRGLGTVRTLVLQNGRRHVGGDVLSSGVTPDVNTIPTDLIERVDITTGANSAVYGSDAIAGVVNFILKQDYEGIQVRGQGGQSKYGDAGSFFVSGLAGKNFAGGRGNIAANVEYAKSNQYFGSSRPFISSQDGFLVVDTDPVDNLSTPALENADTTPDRLFFRDIRSASLTNTGVVRFGGTTATNNCGIDPTGALPGAYYPCVFIFNPDGTLVPATGTRVGISPGSFTGGNSENFRTGRQFQLSPDLERINVNLLGHFEISPALVPFFEAKYSRTDTSGTGSSGPAFIQGATLNDPAQRDPDGTGPLLAYRNREQFRLDNPFLTAQARSVICAQRALSGQTCTNPATLVSIRENLLGLGARTEEAKRETYRVVGGIRGDFLDSWNYELSVNYGRLKEETKVLGNLDRQRFLLGLDAAVNPANGQIQCRSQFDTNAARSGATAAASDPNAAARLAADIAACVPVNPFGGQFSEAVRNYVLRDTTSRGKTSQFDVMGFISGDTGKFFNLPGGPIGFVVGAEYREDNLFYQQDRDVELGYTFYNAIPTFSAPKAKVKEAFGEIRLPILKDRPGFQELEVSAAARVSDYTLGNTGTVWAYNGSVLWSPVNGLRLRGNYGRSVRAPNQSELFSPFSQNFAPAFADPCSSANLAQGSANRAANCAAAGRPGGTDATLNPSPRADGTINLTAPYDYRYQSSLEIRSGGNPLLEAEKSDSLTLGLVATPAFLPGFSFSVDYYDIKVKGVITGVAAQTIVNQCYDLPAGNAFCDLFQRVPAGGTGPRGEQPFRIIEASLIQGPVNFAKRTASGLDFEVAYRRNIAPIGRLDTRLTYTWVFDRSNYADPTNPSFQNVIVGRNGGELGDPEHAFNWNTTLQHGRFTLGYQMRYLSKMYLNTYEDFNRVQGRPEENFDYADRQTYPSRFYHDLRLGIDVGPKFNFYVGADNVTNTKPPLGLTGIGAGSGIYDVRGRFYYSGFVAKF
jgi:outer membrane receptor protein involved in Fe transport